MFMKYYVSGMGLGPILTALIYSLASSQGLTPSTYPSMEALLLSGLALTAAFYLVDKYILR